MSDRVCIECGKPLRAPQRLFDDPRCKKRRHARLARAQVASDAVRPEARMEPIEGGVDRREYARVRAAERAENEAIEREMRRIVAAGDEVGFIFGVPAPTDIVSILSR